MRTSQPGVDLIKHFEDLVLSAYPDPASALAHELRARGIALDEYHDFGAWRVFSGAPWTIGYGHTGPEVVPGLMWTREQSERALEDDLLGSEHQVDQHVAVMIQQRHYDALTSIIFNLGPGQIGKRDGIIHLASGQPSTLLRDLNAGDFSGCADEFLKWNRAGGKVLLGLRRRRAAERALFLGMDWRAAAAAVA